MIKLELSIEEAAIIELLLQKEKDRVHLECTGNQPALERNYPYLDLVEDLRFDIHRKISKAAQE